MKTLNNFFVLSGVSVDTCKNCNTLDNCLFIIKKNLFWVSRKLLDFIGHGLYFLPFGTELVRPRLYSAVHLFTVADEGEVSINRVQLGSNLCRPIALQIQNHNHGKTFKFLHFNKYIDIN